MTNYSSSSTHSSESNSRDNNKKNELAVILKQYPLSGAIFDIIDNGTDQQKNDFIQNYQKAAKLIEETTTKSKDEFKSLGEIYDDLSAIMFDQKQTDESFRYCKLALKAYINSQQKEAKNNFLNFASTRFSFDNVDEFEQKLQDQDSKFDPDQKNANSQRLT